MSAHRQNATITELEMWSDFGRTRCTQLAGETAQLKADLIAITAERDRLAAEVETLKATLVEADAMARKAIEGDA